MLLRGKMGEHCVITVTRQFGSLGRPIARKVAEKLEIPFYDRDLVDQAAAQLGLPISYISQNEEAAGGRYFRMKYPLGTASRAEQDKIYEVQSDLIRSIASKGPCVIVGRCADYVLRDFTNIFSVFIFAPLEERVKNCVETLGMDPQTALSMVLEVDQAREKYHQRYGDYGQDGLLHKDLLLNSSCFGIDRTAEIIAGLVEQKNSM